MVFKLPQEIARLISQARQKQQKIVLATGVFDIIHQEHISFLKKAKQAGDLLLVGIESDKRVKNLKGKDRPVNFQVKRLRSLEKLAITDGIFILPDKFDSQIDHRNLLEQILPDVLAISSHSPFQKEKQNIVDSLDIELRVVHQFNQNISTTLLIKNGLESNKH
jgi:rfaE bifunctional protein nucleotidyltransferase chain/domain